MQNLTDSQFLFFFMWACLFGGVLIAGFFEWVWAKIMVEVDYLTQDGGLW